MASSDKLQPLVLSSNSITTYNDWLSWKRSLVYYLTAKDIDEANRKKAVMMHKGGRELQEIFATLETAHPKGASEDPFEHAIKLLKEHFRPTKNKCYERFLFRQIKQNSDSIEQFMVKLRKQAVRCSFHSIDEAICDQIIDGTSNPVFRHKILEQRLDKLPKIIELGKLLEAVSIQAKSMEEEKVMVASESSSSSIARVLVSKSTNDQVGQQRRRCSRCGSYRHESKDTSCPAINATCFRCQRTDHYANRCRSKETTPASSRERNAVKSKEKKEQIRAQKEKEESRVRAIDAGSEGSSSSSSDANVFRLSSKSSQVTPSNRLPLRLGGLQLKPVVDLGVEVNTLDAETWKRVQKNRAAYKLVPIKKTVFPYGRRESLKFQCVVCLRIESRSTVVENAKFFVLAEGVGEYETIVGYKLAMKLGILRIGEPGLVRQLCIRRLHRESSLGKLKGVQLSIPLDSTVPLVSQPCRRVRFVLRKRIREHTNKLVSDDIIERVSDEPTPWVSPIVPVIKPSGELRLCVDMRQANKAVLCENYPIPTFEELVAEMTDC